MNCNEYQEQTNLFIDGELSMTAQIELFKHLAQCVECQTFIDAMVRIKDARWKEEIPYPPELDEMILSKLDSRKAEPAAVQSPVYQKIPFWKKRIAFPLPIAVSMCVLIIAISFIIDGLFIRIPPAQQTTPASFQQMTEKPTAVIVIYGMPPVDVTGKLTAQSIKYNNRTIQN